MMYWEEKIQDLLQMCKVEGARLLPVPKGRLGDFSIACFDLAKSSNCSPVECAKKLADAVNDKDIKKFGIEKVAQDGPYVNFFVDSGLLAESVIGQIKKEKFNFGKNNIGASRKIIIEYPSNNTHKELHIGHLRNICIGNALYNIFVSCGFDVIRVNYVNDFGTHVARCLWGIKKFHDGEKPPVGREQKWLGEIYAESSVYLKDNVGAQVEVAELQKKLECKSNDIWPLFEKTRKWSLSGFNKAFDELKVKHDTVFFEQNTKKIGQKIVDDLFSKNIAQVGEGGAIIIDLSKFGLDIGLLRKSNGTGLYLTSDLGLAVAKNKKFKNINESIHVTGSEQEFYFKQLFKILEIAGYNYKMTHIPYGLVSRKEGKMSSRSGNVILYEDLRDEVLRKTTQEVRNRHANWDGDKINNTAFRIAMCAIKFEFLKHESLKNIGFDSDAALNFDGFTGPYILYTIARINSILKKTKKCLWFGACLKTLVEPEEKEILLLLSQYPQAILKAFQNYNPSVMAKYCFDLSQKFNDFYSKHSVLNASSAKLIKSRLILCRSVSLTLSMALGLLSIDNVEEM